MATKPMQQRDRGDDETSSLTSFDLEGNARIGVVNGGRKPSPLSVLRQQPLSVLLTGGICLVVGLGIVLGVAGDTPLFRKFMHNVVLSLTSEFVIDFLAGGISGAVAKTCTAPIERVKLLIQTQDANPKVMSGEVERYSGIANCFVRVSREQGVKAFWRGNLANIVRYFPTQAFNFAFKDKIKSLFPRVDKNEEFAKFFAINMASGGLAGAGSLLIVYPLDYARTRLASDVGSGTAQFDGLWDCIKTTYQMGGVRGLYNGIGVSICGIIPYRGVYFGLFDTLSGVNPFQLAGNSFLRASSKFFCAQTSAIVAAYAAYPFDTVRRRLQMQSELPREEWTYQGTMDCFRKIVKDEGVTALFKGAAANVFRTIGAAMVLVMYSEITAALSGDEE